MAAAKPTAAELLSYVSIEVENVIEALARMNEGDGERIEGLRVDAEAEIQRLTTRKRPALTERLDKAVSEALKRKPAGTDVVLRAETVGVGEIENYAQIVEAGADIALEGIKANVVLQSTAYKLARQVFEGRLGVFNKEGLPDIDARRAESKQIMTDTLGRAFEKAYEEDFNSGGLIDQDEMEKQMREKAQYQMSAVTVAFIRAMNDPKSADFTKYAHLFDSIKNNYPGVSLAEAIFTHYGLVPFSKAEIAAQKRARNKQMLTGETVAEPDEVEDDEDEGTATVATRAEKLAVRISKDTKSLNRIKLDELDDDAAEKLRLELAQLVAAANSIVSDINRRRSK